MVPTIPEKQKLPGVSYAVNADGLELPVIDITHPAFDCSLDDEQISCVIDQTLAGLQASRALPPETILELPKRSILWRGTFESMGTYMSGMMTYLMRLGPANLGAGYANDLDRAMASTILPLSFRFRLRDMAHALCDALTPGLVLDARRPLELLNIAGGTAMDSLNALILLKKRSPDLLASRTIRIRVCDLDEQGPRFAGQALAALMGPGGALHGVHATLIHTPYDWKQPDDLGAVLSSWDPRAVSACSSEGGLFDYGDDADITAHLRLLSERTPQDAVVVGSVVRDLGTLDPRLYVTATMKNRPTVRWLGLEAFRVLARDSGWSITRSLDSTAHHVVVLGKAG